MYQPDISIYKLQFQDHQDYTRHSETTYPSALQIEHTVLFPGEIPFTDYLQMNQYKVEFAK